MPKNVAVDENKRRFELINKERSWLGDILYPFECEKCGAPVNPEKMEKCWNCGHPKAIDKRKPAK